jgi:hypothetical protein
MRLVLDKIDEMQPGNLKLKQFAGDLANTLKSTYESKIRPAVTGGTQGAGMGGASFLDSLGLSGLAKAYKDKAEAKENKRQEKEKFVGDFQKYSAAGQTLTADTARQVGESTFNEIDTKKKQLATLENEDAARKEAGYGSDPENLKQQQELLTAIKALDPRSKPEGSIDKNVEQVQSEEKTIEAAEAAATSLEIETKQGQDLTALYTITDDFFKKQDKRTEEMLEALKFLTNVDYGGGGGGSALGAIGDLMGGKGKAAGKVGKAAGAAGKLAGAASTAARFAPAAAGVLGVGAAAYEAYGDYNAADEKVKSGEITKEQGQVEKGKAVGGGVGAAAGALGGAKAGALAGAALGSFIPGLGTVVGGAIGGIAGGALGYFGGKKVGQAVGGGGVAGYQSLAGTSEAGAVPPTTKTSAQMEVVANEPVEKGKPLSANQVAVVDMAMKMGNKPSPLVQESYDLAKKAMQPVPQAAPSMAGAELKSANNQLENTRDAAAASVGGTTNTVVNAPVTNVSNTNNNDASPKGNKTRNDDTTFNRYVDRRYYPSYK